MDIRLRHGFEHSIGLHFAIVALGAHTVGARTSTEALFLVQRYFRVCPLFLYLGSRQRHSTVGY